MTRSKEIEALEAKLGGLSNDARYWDLIRTYGEHSPEVLRHLQACAAYQGLRAQHKKEMTTMATHYYHAGAMRPETNDVYWSNHTRRSAAAAEREARRMSQARPGTVPVVEMWAREHGLCPGDCELISGAYEVES